MATLNGFIRSYSAAVRRSERAQQRRARESARLYKLQLKQTELTDSAKAVADYNEYVDVLKSVHKDCSDAVDWVAIKLEPEPLKPVKNNKHEKEAQVKHDIYKPSRIDKIFGSVKRKMLKFERRIMEGADKDQKIYDDEFSRYLKSLEDWTELQNMSSAVLANDPSGYKDAVAYFNPFSEIKELGSELDLKFNNQFITVDLKIHNEEVIPKLILSTTSTGKLSKKIMPISRFNELYQDHVCSSVLRVGRETLACLPLKFVVVNAVGNILNTSTGLIESLPILSVAIFPETLNKLNIDTVDASDSMKNFIHNMKFSKTNGFLPVDRMDGKSLMEN